MRAARMLPLAAAVLAASCTPLPDPGARFVEESAPFGSPGVVKEASGGFVLYDHDGDGVLDLFSPNGYSHANNWGSASYDPVTPQLFLGKGDSTFESAPLADFIEPGWYATASAGDFDRDGRVDVFLPGVDRRLPSDDGGTETLRGPDYVILNTEAGLADGTSDLAPSATTFGACHADFDNDGVLDLVLANYRDPEFFEYDEDNYRVGQPNALYRGNGDGTFTDVTASSGDFGTGVYWSDACLTFDYDNDGLTDIWIANDGAPIRVFRNVGNMTFEEDGERALGPMHNAVGNWMGFALGDYDGDGDEDVFATNFGISAYSLVSPTSLSHPDHYVLHALFQNQGDGTFVDVAPEIEVNTPRRMDPSWEPPEGTTGLALWEFGWAAAFQDYDNDGDLDLYWNGNLALTRYAQVVGTADHGANPGRLLQNEGDGVFTEVTEAAGIMNVDDEGFILNGWGSALADLNGDGWLDLVVGNQWFNDEAYPGGIRVFTNTGGENHYLDVVLEAVESNPSGIGAIIEVQAGGVVQTRQVGSQSALSTLGPVPVHFGLGELTSVEEVRVRWPSGREQVVTGVSVDGPVTVTEPSE